MEADLQNLKEYEEANNNLSANNEELTAINTELKNRLENSSKTSWRKKNNKNLCVREWKTLRKLINILRTVTLT